MKNTKGFPLYVRLGLLGIHSRRGALIQFWTAVGVSLLLLIVVPGISHSFFWTMVFCGSVLLTAKWYWSAIQWVDAHAGWGPAPASPGAAGGNVAPGAEGGNVAPGTAGGNVSPGAVGGNVASGGSGV